MKHMETWTNFDMFRRFYMPSGSLPHKIEMNLREDGINYDIKIHTKVNNNGTEMDAIISSIAKLPGNIELKMEYEDEERGKAEMYNIVIPE